MLLYLIDIFIIVNANQGSVFFAPLKVCEIDRLQNEPSTTGGGH